MIWKNVNIVLNGSQSHSDRKPTIGNIGFVVNLTEVCFKWVG